jgi:RNA polymerase primary sigma factor
MASERELCLFVPIALLEAIDSLHRTRNHPPSEAPSETSEPVNETDEEYIPRFLAEIEAGGEEARRAFGEAIRKVFVMLAPREEQILRMRFGIGFDKALSLEEVGKQFGLTADGIREVEAKTLRKLRQTSRSRNLEGFQEK